MGESQGHSAKWTVMTPTGFAKPMASAISMSFSLNKLNNSYASMKS